MLTKIKNICSSLLFYRRNEKGQVAAGYLTLIMAIMALTISALKYYQSIMKEEATGQYTEMALQAAHSGFIDAFAWMRRNQGQEPSDYPDDMFFNGVTTASDTDFFNIPVADPVGNSALVRSFAGPERITDTSATYATSTLWTRYVIKRQFLPNYPLSNTQCAEWHDKEAAHNLTYLRDDVDPLMGKNIWSFTSVGYVFNAHENITDTALHVGEKLYNSPIPSYPDGSRLLLGKAKVNGEVLRITLANKEKGCSLWMKDSRSCTISSGCTIGEVGDDYGYISDGTPNFSSTSGILASTNKHPSPADAPSYGAAFGFGINSLKKVADTVGSTKNILPPYDTSDMETYKEQVSRQRFLIIDGDARFTQLTGSDPTHRRLEGAGLMIITGDLIVDSSAGGSWNGGLYVNGNVTINEPYSIRGMLISPGTVRLNSGTDVSSIAFSQAALDSAEDTIFNYRIDRTSMSSTLE